MYFNYIGFIFKVKWLMTRYLGSRPYCFYSTLYMIPSPTGFYFTLGLSLLGIDFSIGIERVVYVPVLLLKWMPA